MKISEMKIDEMKNAIYESLAKRCFDKISVCKKEKDIYEIKTDNADKVAEALYESFYNQSDCFYRYENVVFNCAARKSVLIYSDLLSAYKRRDFDERNETLLLKQSEEKPFRFLLNEYIVGFKPREISKRKNLYLDITPQGKFIALKKAGYKSINCNLSTNEQTVFNFLCFMEINKFRQFVNSVKDFNYIEKPLILVNFPDFLDESFDYISFLARQKLNRKIIVVSDTLCTENAALSVV